MLALKQALSIVSTPETSGWMPSSVNGLEMWLKDNNLIEADQNAAGASLSPVHSTTANTMATGDLINLWTDFTGGGFNGVQDTQGDKPHWDRENTVDPYVPAFDGTQFMDMAESVDISANQDFTIVTNIMFTDLSQNAIYGSDSSNFFRINDDTGFRCKIGGAGNNNFTEASDTIVVDRYYTLIFTRSNGATGDLRLYVDGGTYSDKAWGSTALTDNDAFTISNIGAAADDTDNMKGYIKNIIVYKGTVLTAAERRLMYTYLAQPK